MMRYTLLFVLFLSFVACDDIIGVEDISKDTVIVIAPSNGVILDTTSVIFTWEAMEDTESYHLQIATPNFANADQIVKDTLLIGSSFSTQLEHKAYEWRIRAENLGYVTAYTTQQFTIEE